MWDKNKPSYIGVLPRDGSSEVRWFKGPTRFSMHFVNAWEEDGKITLQATMSSPEDRPFFPPVDETEPPKEWAPSTIKVVNWIMDLNGDNDQIVEEILIDEGSFIEFPRVDHRVETTRHRHVWWAIKDFNRPSVPHPLPIVSFNGIERRDEHTGQRDTYWTDERWTFGEPIFIPRHAESPEGDGFVIAPVFRIEGQGNGYMVFDAMNISQGPLATIHVPFHFRPGFHGNWVSATDLQKAKNIRT
jgi:carotenoid cleavage dioxygenase